MTGAQTQVLFVSSTDVCVWASINWGIASTFHCYTYIRIPQNTFQDAFQNWKKSWELCINSRGEYLEGDKSD